MPTGPSIWSPAPPATSPPASKPSATATSSSPTSTPNAPSSPPSSKTPPRSFGPDHVFELTNGRYDELIGHRPLIGRTVRDAFPDLVGQGFFEILDRVYRTGEPFVGNELPISFSPSPNRPAAALRYLNFVYQPTRDARGNVTGIFVHGVDITDLVHARDAIRESESRFRQLADAMPQIVFAAQPDGHVDYFNQRWYEYTGLPAGAIGYESWKHVHTEEGLARVSARWAESVRTGEPYEIEYLLRRHDGEYRWHLGRALPVRDDAGRVVRWFGTNTDIHDQKLLEIERATLLASERNARGDAETANQAKDRFLATLSHELRTPLTPVAMTAAAMEADPALPAEFRDDVAMIRRNVQLETQLIDDLLDLSRVLSGKMRLRPQPTDAHRLVRHVLEMVGAELYDKSLTVHTDLAADSHDVLADTARLQQALWNLLKNAAKFTPAGGAVTIRTRNDPPGHLAIEVADTGKGISPDALARIFEPFEQGDPLITARFGGLGLGLSIAKAVADLHDGTLHADSPGEGLGATFTFTLPLSRVPAAQPAACPEPDTAALGRPVRVLLVEDHPDTAKTLTRLLRLDGMDVQCAETVAAGLRLAANSPFDVIVSDLGLPDGTGHDLMRRLRTRIHAVGIAMSGYGMEEDIRQSHDAGFVEHLVKPVSLADLRQAIRRAAARFGTD